MLWCKIARSKIWYQSLTSLFQCENFSPSGLFQLGSLAVVVVGALLKYLPDKLTEIIFGVTSIVVKDEDRTAFHIPDLKDVTNLPFVGDAGVALMVFGGVLFCISFMACCGASGKWKLLLLGVKTHYFTLYPSLYSAFLSLSLFPSAFLLCVSSMRCKLFVGRET